MGLYNSKSRASVNGRLPAGTVDGPISFSSRGAAEEANKKGHRLKCADALAVFQPATG